MAEVIEDGEWPTPASGSGGVYPWDEWLDGQPRRLRQGVDFEVRPEAFRSAATMAAGRRRIRVRTSVRGDEVYVQRIVEG